MQNKTTCAVLIVKNHASLRQMKTRNQAKVRETAVKQTVDNYFVNDVDNAVKQTVDNYFVNNVDNAMKQTVDNYFVNDVNITVKQTVDNYRQRCSETDCR